jgi:hypothetical protein
LFSAVPKDPHRGAGDANRAKRSAIIRHILNSRRRFGKGDFGLGLYYRKSLGSGGRGSGAVRDITQQETVAGSMSSTG